MLLDYYFSFEILKQKILNELTIIPIFITIISIIISINGSQIITRNLITKIRSPINKSLQLIIILRNQ
jgi:hypothetical protein